MNRSGKTNIARTYTVLLWACLSLAAPGRYTMAAAAVSLPHAGLQRLEGFATPDGRLVVYLEACADQSVSGTLELVPATDDGTKRATIQLDSRGRLVFAGHNLWFSQSIAIEPGQARFVVVEPGEQTLAACLMATFTPDGDQGPAITAAVYPQTTMTGVVDGRRQHGATPLFRDLPSLYVGVEDLPSDSREAVFSVVIIGLVEFAQLTGEQSRALADLVANGGGLLIVDNAPTLGPPVLSGDLQRLLPLQLGRKHRSTPGAFLEAVTAGEWSDDIELPCREFSSSGPQREPAGIPFRTYRFGLGRVGYIAFDALHDRFLAWHGAHEFWLGVYTRVPHSRIRRWLPTEYILRGLRPEGVELGPRRSLPSPSDLLARTLSDPTAGSMILVLLFLAGTNIWFWFGFARKGRSWQRLVACQWALAAGLLVCLSAARILMRRGALYYSFYETRWFAPETGRRMDASTMSFGSRTPIRVSFPWRQVPDLVLEYPPFRFSGTLADRVMAARQVPVPTDGLEVALEAYGFKGLAVMHTASDRQYGLQANLKFSQDGRLCGYVHNDTGMELTDGVLVFPDSWRPGETPEYRERWRTLPHRYNSVETWRSVPVPMLAPGQGVEIAEEKVEQSTRLPPPHGALGLSGPHGRFVFGAIRHCAWMVCASSPGPVALFAAAGGRTRLAPEMRTKDHGILDMTLMLQVVDLDCTRLLFEKRQGVAFLHEEKPFQGLRDGAVPSTEVIPDREIGQEAMFPLPPVTILPFLPFGNHLQYRLPEQAPENVVLDMVYCWKDAPAFDKEQDSTLDAGEAVLYALDQQRGEWVEVWQHTQAAPELLDDEELRVILLEYRRQREQSEPDITDRGGAHKKSKRLSCPQWFSERYAAAKHMASSSDGTVELQDNEHRIEIEFPAEGRFFSREMDLHMKLVQKNVHCRLVPKYAMIRWRSAGTE